LGQLRVAQARVAQVRIGQVRIGQVRKGEAAVAEVMIPGPAGRPAYLATPGRPGNHPDNAGT